MSSVLDFFREQEPKFKEVGDDDLTSFIGQAHPEFLADAEFGAEFSRLHPSPSLQPVPMPSKGSPYENSEFRIQNSEGGGNPTIEAARQLEQQFKARWGMAAGERNAPVRKQLREDYFNALRAIGVEPLSDWDPLGDVGRLIGPTMARAGKVSQAAIGDVASVVAGVPAENISSFAKDPEGRLPIQEQVEAAPTGARIAGKISLAGASAIPIVGAAAAGGAAGLPQAAANLGVMAFDEGGRVSPLGVTAALGLPIVDQAGRRLAADLIQKRLKEIKFVWEPGAIAPKVANRFPALEKEAVQRALEVGGGQLANNVFLLAVQTPGILDAEDPKKAFEDAVISNVALSVLGAPEIFTGRGSQTMRDIRQRGGLPLRTEKVTKLERVQPELGQAAPPQPGPGPAATPAPPAGPVQTSGPGPNVVFGKGTTVFGANDTKLPALYAWAPASEIQASHTGEMFSLNPKYAPVKNTRRYHEDVAEREKVLKGAREFRPESYATNVKGAAEGPVMVSRGSDGVLRVLGGNGRFQMIQRLTPEQRADFGAIQDEEAAVFGLGPRPSEDHILVRLLAGHDVSKPEEVNRTVDVLNPSPGLVESTASMARNDAAKIPIEALEQVRPDSGPAVTRPWLAGLIAQGVIDRNTRTQVLNNDAQLADYTQRLLVEAAYRSDQVADLRADPKTLETVKGLVDAGVPLLVQLRAKGEEQVAQGFTEMLQRAADFQRQFPDRKFDDILRQVHGQAEGFETEAGTLARSLALALSSKVERLPINRRGERKIDPEETGRNFREFFESLARSVKAAEAVPDLFGKARSVMEVLRDFLRAQTGDEPIVLKEEEGGGYAVRAEVRRLNALTAARKTRKLTPAEEKELVELEDALGQSFMAFHREEMAQQREREKEAQRQEAQRLELEARARKRLVAGQIETQKDLYGPATEEGGPQLTMFERGRRLRYSERIPRAVQQPAEKPVETEGAGTGGGGAPDREGQLQRRAASLATRIKALNAALPRRPDGTIDFAKASDTQLESLFALEGERLDLEADWFRLHGRSVALGHIRHGEAGIFRELQGELFAGYAPDAPPPTPAQLSADAKTIFRALLGQDPKAYQELFAQGDTVSSIIAKVVTRQIPNFDVRGQVINKPLDFVLLTRALRSPLFETLKVAVLNVRNKVVYSQVLTAGNQNSTIWDPLGFTRVIEAARGVAKGKLKVIVSHNHPSGDPGPSDPDRQMTRQIEAMCATLGVEFLDHLVTNGDRYYTFRGGGFEAMPAEHLSAAAWEVVPRMVLPPMESSAQLAAVAASLRNADPGYIHVMYVTTRLQLTAVERMPEDLEHKELQRRIMVGAAREGAYGILLDLTQKFGEGFDYYGAKSYINEPGYQLFRLLFRHLPGVKLLDVTTPQTPSYRAAGYIENDSWRAVSRADENVLREEGEVYQSAGMLSMPDTPVKKGTPIVMGGMQHVQPVEMPELVRLAKLLTGEVPGLKRFPRAAGMFYGRPGHPHIKLHPGVFKSSQQAAKVLAHEIGHLIDFLPHQTLARGNLFGRLASLREWLLRTFPLKDPGGSQADLAKKVITEEDRKRLRRAAERHVGARPPKDEEADLAAWRQAVAEEYRERLEQEIESRGLAKIDVVTEELWQVSQYWHPLPEEPTKSYLAYRQSAVELYADALSVLLNSPGLLEEMAPTFYGMFWEYLDRKPEMKRVLFDLQDFLNMGKVPVLQRRQDDIEAMYTRGEEIIRRKAEERELRRKSWKGYWLELKQQVFDTYAPVIEKARAAEKAGANFKAGEDPRNILEQGFMVDNANVRLVQALFEKVIKPLEARGISLVDLGEYLFLTRVMKERRELANPLGMTPEAAREGMLKFRLDQGIENMTVLEAAVAKFHELVFETIEEAVRVGSYSREVFEEKIKPNRDVYAAFAVLDYLEDFVPAGIRRQVGTLKEIANPFTATVLKTVSLNNLNNLQRSKNATRDLLTRFFPAEIEKAEGRFVTPGFTERPLPKADRGTFMVLENGKPAYYYVDPLIVEAFEKLSPQGLHRVLRVLDAVFRKGFYRLYITYSPSFLLFNPVRDFSRAWMNLPEGAGVLRLAWAYARSFASAIRHVAGMPDGLAQEMIANYAIGAPYETLVRGFRDDQFGDLLRRFHLLPEKDSAGWFDHWFFAPVRTLGRAMEFYGSMQEVLPKMAAYRLGRERMKWAPAEAAAFARNYAGTPNIFKRGRSINVVRAVVPFFNVFAQGWRADIRRMNPKTSFAWVFRWAMSDGLWAIVAALASAGILGAALKELFAGISEYDKTNYNVLPVGWTAGGEFGRRIHYVRVPRNESSRFISGLTYKLTRLLAGDSPEEWTDLLEFGAGSMPTVNPAVTIPAKWAEFASGRNPEDPFRGRPIVPRTEFEAGGWDSLKPMFLWTFDESGAGAFVKWNADAQTTTELVTSAIPGINRVVKTSDHGYREQQMGIEREADQERARHRLAMPDNARSLLLEYTRLRSIDALRRTPEQAGRYEALNVWYNSLYRRFDEDIELLEQAGNKTAAAAMRRSLEAASTAFERQSPGNP